jgi:uncharacterized protein YecE (DUF72 family)
VLPVKNKSQYPEEHRESSRLHYYSVLFTSIEVNSTFYKLPQKKTIERWSSDTTQNFRFTFKVSKSITHNKQFAFAPSSIKEFLCLTEIPARKKGCLLIQMPGKTTAEYFDQLKKLLGLIKKHSQNNEWKIAVEFRHESWYSLPTIKLLKKHKATCVIHDLRPFSVSLLDPDVSFVYLRFHGTEKNYRGTYSNEILQHYATQIGEWLSQGKEVYAYFNNTLGTAAYDLVRLNNMVYEITTNS